MRRPKIYITRNIPQPGLDILKNDCELEFWDSDEAIPKEDLLAKVAGVDGLLCMLTDPIDKDVLDAAGSNLKVVSTMSVGYEHIDLEECKERGIHVTNTPNVSTDSVAELTVTLLLITSRRLLEGVAAIRSGEWLSWQPTWLCGTEITGKTLGILGLGRIGYGVASRIKPFGISKVLYHDVCAVSYASDLDAEFVEFNTLLAECDFICVCCNLTPQTKHKFNVKTFKKMKNTAILINSGRGGVINHEHLYDALKNGEIQAAGLDVTEPEPLPADHKLLTLSNCIVLPHMGSNTWESRNLMAETAAKNIMAVLHKERAIGQVI